MGLKMFNHVTEIWDSPESGMALQLTFPLGADPYMSILITLKATHDPLP